MAALLEGKVVPPLSSGLVGTAATAPEWARDCAEKKCVGLILETAHPSKFGETVREAIGSVITSYSIHYTKLYEGGRLVLHREFHL